MATFVSPHVGGQPVVTKRELASAELALGGDELAGVEAGNPVLLVDEDPGDRKVLFLILVGLLSDPRAHRLLPDSEGARGCSRRNRSHRNLCGNWTT